jgi:hypothetical protein
MTQTVEVKDLGKLGLITDLLGIDLPPNEITSGINIRYRDFKIVRSNGFMAMGIDLSAYAGYVVAGISSVITDSRNGIVIAMKNVANEYIFLFYNNTTAAPTAIFTQYADATKMTSPYRLQWDDIYGAKIINVKNTRPLIYDLANANARELEHWGEFQAGVNTSFRATILTTFKGFYMALNTEENGISYPNRIRWSDIISYPIETGNDPQWIENDPAFLGGYLDIPDEVDTITAAKILGDRLIIYTQFSCYSVQYTADSFVFQVQKLYSQRGAASLNCVVEFENKHFCLNNSQFYIHDGQTIQDVALNKVQVKLIELIQDGYRNSFLYKNGDKNEIWICFSAKDPNSVMADTAAVWNWKTGQWSYMDLPGLVQIASGPPFYPFSVETATRTYDNTFVSYDFFIDKTTEYFETRRTGLFTFFASGILNNIYLGDFGYSRSGVSYTTSFGRNYIDLSEVFQGISPMKNITRLIPNINGTGKIKLRVGRSNTISEEITWNPNLLEMDLDAKNWKIDFRCNCRYFSYEIIQDDIDKYFEITSFDLEVNSVGRR